MLLSVSLSRSASTEDMHRRPRGSARLSPRAFLASILTSLRARETEHGAEPWRRCFGAAHGRTERVPTPPGPILGPWLLAGEPASAGRLRVRCGRSQGGPK